MDIPADMPQSETPHNSLTRMGEQLTRGEQPQTSGVLRAGDACQKGEGKKPYADTQSAIEATEE